MDPSYGKNAMSWRQKRHLFPPIFSAMGSTGPRNDVVVFCELFSGLAKKCQPKTSKKTFIDFRAFRVPKKKEWQKHHFFFHRKKQKHSLALPCFLLLMGFLGFRHQRFGILASGRDVWCSTYLLNLATPLWCWWPRKLLGRAPLKSEEQKTLAFLNWVVVSTIFYFHPYLGRFPF